MKYMPFIFVLIACAFAQAPEMVSNILSLSGKEEAAAKMMTQWDKIAMYIGYVLVLLGAAAFLDPSGKLAKVAEIIMKVFKIIDAKRFKKYYEDRKGKK